jgi:ABC-2 type transport system permease protein
VSANANALTPYLAVISVRFRMLLQYRAAAFAGMVTQVFWGAVKLMVLAAFYAGASGAVPMRFSEVVAYVWLGQALFALLPWNIDDELAMQMRSGNVAVELLRPLDLYAYWFARTLAFRTARASLRMLPMIVLAGVALPLLGLERWALPPPDGLASGGLFALSLLLTVLLSTAITMLLQVSLLYTVSSEGIVRTAPSVVTLLSGMIVPLPLFPEWLQPALALQPFRGLVDVPFRIYSGHIAPLAALGEIAQQLAWFGALCWLGRVLLQRALRRVVIQGG